MAGQPAAWQAQKEDVERALQRSRPTAPGPDGISSVLWRRLGPLAIDVLSDAARALSSETAAEDIAKIGIRQCAFTIFQGINNSVPGEGINV